MSRFYLPKSELSNINAKRQNLKGVSAKTVMGTPVTFDDIKGFSTLFRSKIFEIADFLEEHNAPSHLHIDLTDECVALRITEEDIEYIKNSDFDNFIALLGITDGHLTFSLLGADEADATRISSRYKSEEIFGVETWPRRGLLGIKKDFDDVLDCK